jgi:hypothetical protein
MVAVAELPRAPMALQGLPEGFLGHFRDVVRLSQIAAQGLPACNFDLL